MQRGRLLSSTALGPAATRASPGCSGSTRSASVASGWRLPGGGVAFRRRPGARWPPMARLLGGPAGPLAMPSSRHLIGELESANLLGRGGAAFPVGRKWRAVAERASGRAVVLANGAEGEPLSLKDRTLMATRPHLVIDGALLAAEAVGAPDIIIYVGAGPRAAEAAIRGALAERSNQLRSRVRMMSAPDGYVAGEESAAVHFINAGDARPTTTPPRPFERGVDGRPTLVQNVESLAMAAQIARGIDANTG